MSKEDDTRKLLGLMGVDNSVPGTSLYGRIRKLVSEELPPDKLEEGMRFLDDFFRDDPFASRMTARQMAAYGDRLSHEEILELIAFYESPVGRRLVQIVPSVMKDIVDANIEVAAGVASDVRRGLLRAGLTPADEAAEAAKSSILEAVMKGLLN